MHLLAENLYKVKMNSLSDFGMIDKLYETSNAGVKIQLEVRGICSLFWRKGMSANEAISIVDNYLEHSRIYIFVWSNRSFYFVCRFHDT
jgi:polyphosphate kinase